MVVPVDLKFYLDVSFVYLNKFELASFFHEICDSLGTSVKTY